MKKYFFISFVIFMAIMFSGCFWNVEKIKEKAPERLSEAGFEIVAHQGTQMGITGGKVWYILRSTKSPERGIYSASLSYMVSGDLGIYELRSIDVLEVK